METDYYLQEENCIGRLAKEWKKYGNIIIGLDFDDTIYDFHKKGRTYDNVINIVKEAQKHNAKVIIITANDDKEHYKFIREYCESIGIRVDAINENLPEIPFNTKKVYCNILLDDRAGLRSAYNTLYNTLVLLDLYEAVNAACGEYKFNPSPISAKDLVQEVSFPSVPVTTKLTIEKVNEIYKGL